MLTDVMEKILYQGIQELKNSVKEIIYSKITRKISDIRKEIKLIQISTHEKHNSESKNINNNSGSQNLYSSAVILKNVNSCTEKIVLKPINQQSSEQIIQELKNNIDIAKLGVGVNKVINKSNGNVISYY